MNGVEFLAVLLSLFLAELQAMDYQCNVTTLSNCTNNTRLIVMKSQQSYKVTLYTYIEQCYNSFCIVSFHEDEKEVMCDSICNSCAQFQPRGEKGKTSQVYL